MKNMNIVFGVDDNCAEHRGVTFASVLYNLRIGMGNDKILSNMRFK
jgi:lipopolysaccharide biosynthesis glycosyltransferase